MRKKKLAAVLLLLPAIGLGGWAIHQGLRTVDAPERSSPDEALSRYRECMYGSPLLEGESASARAQAMSLCANRPSGWPQDCEAHLRAALQSLAKGREASTRRLRHAIEDVLRTSPALPDGPRTLDDLEQAMAEAPRATAASEEGTPCAPAPLVRKLPITRLGRGGMFARSDRFVGKALRVVWAGGSSDESLACWFSEASPMARCGSPLLSSLARPLSSEGGVPNVHVSDFQGSRHRVVDMRGTELLKSDHRILDGRVDVAGSLTVAGEGDEVFLVHPGEEPERLRISEARAARASTMVGDWLLWLEGGPDRRRVRAVLLSHDAQPGGEAFDTGFTAWSDVIGGCRRRAGDVLVLESGAERDAGSEPWTVQVAWQRGTSFSTVVSGHAEVPAPGSFVADRRTSFGCDSHGAARWLWLRDGAVHELVCAEAGCRERKSERLTLLDGARSRMALAPLGDDRVLFAYSIHPQHGRPSLAVRVAPIAQLAGARDTVVVGEPEVELFAGELSAFGRGSVGWVTFVSGTNEVFALQVDPDGEIVPVTRDL
jgi:hypothetical protein